MDLAAAGRTAAALAGLVTAVGPEAGAVVARSVCAGAPSPALVALAAAPWRAVVTTGLGPQWVEAHGVAAVHPVVLTAGCPLDEQVEDEEVRFLIHVLGRADAPDTLCLAPTDLRRRVVDTGLADVLIDLARRCTLLFAGFRPGDPDLEWVAGRILGAAGGDRPHYLVCGDAATAAEAGLEPLISDGPADETLAVLAAAASATPRRRRRSSAQPRAAARWRRAADTLQRLADVDRDPDAQAMYLYAAALIHRDRMGDSDGATGILDRALELDPALAPAWEALAHLVESDLPPPPGRHPLPPPGAERDDEQMLLATRILTVPRRGQA
jgi:hypothetical protein